MTECGHKPHSFKLPYKMTVLQSLQQLNLYPIPDSVVINACENRGVTASEEITTEMRGSLEYKLLTADMYRWLAFAPTTVSQGGTTFSISESDKQRYLSLSNRIFGENGETKVGTTFGYIGNRL